MKILSRDIAALFEKPNSTFFAYLLHGMDAGLIDERAKELALLFSDNLHDIRQFILWAEQNLRGGLEL